MIHIAFAAEVLRVVSGGAVRSTPALRALLQHLDDLVSNDSNIPVPRVAKDRRVVGA